MPTGVSKALIFRYIIVLLYSIPNMSNAIVWITFAPITSEVEDVYNAT